MPVPIPRLRAASSARPRRARARIFAACACAVFSVLAARVPAEAQQQQSPPTGLVTAGTGGAGVSGYMGRQRQVSADGRYVVFLSESSELVANDTNGGFLRTRDVFVRDRHTGRTILVSVNKNGTDSGDGSSNSPVITPDGRYVAFTSLARDLVHSPSGPIGFQNVYLRDLQEGKTTLVSWNLAGTGAGNSTSGGDASSSVLSVSSDGRFVCFESMAGNLVEGDTNGMRDVFVRDLLEGKTILVSINAAGTGSGSSESTHALMTPDGRHVAFRSSAGNLLSGSASHPAQIYIRDLQAKTTRLVSANSQGTPSNASPDSRGMFDMDVSDDGRYVAFVSSASDIVAGDANGGSADTGQDVFLRDVEAGQTRLVSVNAAGTGSADGNSGAVSLTPDGRFVAFSSFAGNVVAGDANNQEDSFLRDMQAGLTKLVTVDLGGGAAGVGGSPNAPTFIFTHPVSVSDDGRYVAFSSSSPNLVTTPDHNTNNTYPPGWDVFVRDMQASQTRLVSINHAGVATGNGYSTGPEITGDGRFVVFSSAAGDIVGPDAGGGLNLFVHVALPQAGPELRFRSALTSAAEGAGKVTVVVGLSAPAPAPVSVVYETAGGTARAGVDYTPASGTLTFQPGETARSFDVPVRDDPRGEGDEKIYLRLKDLSGPAKMGEPAVAAALISDDDPPPAISVGDVRVVEGNSNGSAVARFLVSLSGDTDKTVTVDYITQGGTATSGLDFQPLVGQVTFLPGMTTQHVNIPILSNTTPEGDETFSLLLSNPVNAVIADAQGACTIVEDDGVAPLTLVAVNASTFLIAERSGRLEVRVVRSGDTSGASSVSYATAAGSASDISDYTAAAGTVKFAPGETSKTVTLFLTDDAFIEGVENFFFVLSNPLACTIVSPSPAIITVTSDDAADGPSPVRWDAAFDPAFFVRQHYLDFLNREPDAAGLAFWSGQITECGADAGCAGERRQNVSAAFFLSVEFQQTGYLVYRATGAAFGTRRVGGAVPLTLAEFLPDTQQIGAGVVVGADGWEPLLEQNKRAYLESFVLRPQFNAAYPQTMTPAQFVDALNANTSGSLSPAERDALVAELSANNTTQGRASVLRAVAEDADFDARERNRAFVLMQYFGYLRRNPNDAPEPALDFQGYNFWLAKLVSHGGNHVSSEMVRSFLVSGEYQKRFGKD